MKNYTRHALLNPVTQRIDLSFPFSYDFLEEIKNITGWNFEGANRQWSLPLCKNSIKAVIDLNFQLSPNLNNYWEGTKESVVKKPITITVDNSIHLPEKDVTPFILEKIRTITAFTVPHWEGGHPKYFDYLCRDEIDYLIPKGALQRLKRLFEELSIQYILVDKTRRFSEIDFEFKLKAYRHQHQAINAILSNKFCVVNAPTASGKTVMGLYITSQHRQPTCIIVHSSFLMYQWKERAEEYLGLVDDQIGLIGDGLHSIGSHITICIVNSLCNCIDSVKDKFGFLIVDEVHRAAGKMFSTVINQFDCHDVLGLSATHNRSDGASPLINLFCGDMVHYIDPKALVKAGKIAKGHVITRRTNFKYPYKGNYAEMLKALVEDGERNEFIVRDVLKHLQDKKGMAIIISNRREHCKTLYELLVGKVKAEYVTSDKKYRSKEKVEIIRLANEGLIDALVTTNKLLGEGFDCDKISTCFLTIPLSSEIPVKQVIGRASRVTKDRVDSTIYDYLDDVGVLKGSYYKRCKIYRDLGMELVF